MVPQIKVLRSFVALFDRLRVTYAVMGGMAVRLYGIPRPTWDVDFTAVIAREALPKLLDEASKLGFSVPESQLTGWQDDIQGMPIIKFKWYADGDSIDVDIFLVETAYQKTLIARRQLRQVDNYEAWFVTPEDLILLKLISYRVKDQADIADIVFTQGQLDEPYLRNWAGALQVETKLEQALSPDRPAR